MTIETESCDRCEPAREVLSALLALPDERPGAWEARHVSALQGELRAVLGLLDNDDDDGAS